MPGERPIAVVVTCEHAGCEAPGECRTYFRGRERVLRTHLGYDIGAAGVAREMASRLRTRAMLHYTSRLVVEINRSPDHAALFSEFTRGLPERVRASLVDRYYTPHRTEVQRTIQRIIGRGRRVLHAGIHSFTRRLGDETRDVQVGLLFDPSRAFESEVCARWRDAIRSADPSLDVRFNEPYKGVDDGLTTYLRTKFSDTEYAGVEIEVRNDLIARGPQQRRFGALLASTVPAYLPPSVSPS